MNDKSDKKRIFKNTVLVSAASVIEKIIFFLINVFIARYLSLEHYGEYTTALGYATFFSVFTNIGINNALVRAINLETQLEKEHFANSLFIKTVLAFVVFIVMSMSLYFTNYNINTIYLTLIFGIVRIGNEYMLAFYALHESKEKFSIPAFFTISFSISFLISTIIIIILKGNYFHFAYVRANIVVFFVILLAFITFKYIKPRLDFSTTRDFIKETIPFSLAIVFNNIIQRSNIIILSLIHGTLYSGIFNNGYLLILSILFIPTNINRILLPYLYKFSFSENRGKYQFAFDIFSKLLSVISFYILIILLLYSNELIVSIFGEKYIDSISVLKILSPCIPLSFNIAGTLIISIDKQRFITVITGLTLLLNIVFNLILIYYYKAEGAAIALSLTSLAYFIMLNSYIVINKIINFSNTMKLYIKLVLITAVLYIIDKYIFNDINSIIAIISTSLLFVVFTALFIIRRDDLRIAKEIVGN